MRRILVSAAVVALGIASLQTASAADISAPVYKAPPAAVGYNWTGFYLGIEGGYGWGRSGHRDGGAGAVDFDLSGGLVGITGGYNWQAPGSQWVVGIEGDWSWTDINGSAPSSATFACAGTCNTDIRGNATLRGRVGWAFDRILPYVTAGVAWSRLHASIGTPVLAEATTTRASFTGGAGVEVGITPNVSAKLEWLYVDGPGRFTYAPAFCAAPGCATVKNDYSMVRAGLNWRFGGM